jgi:hypothetical protein
MADFPVEMAACPVCLAGLAEKTVDKLRIFAPIAAILSTTIRADNQPRQSSNNRNNSRNRNSLRQHNKHKPLSNRLRLTATTKRLQTKRLISEFQAKSA